MDYGLCFCSYLKIVGDEFVIVPSYNISNAREQIGKSSFISTQTMIVRSDILKSVGGFDQRLPKLQDWDLVLRLAEVTKFAYLNIPLALVYDTSGSISSFKENEIPAREIILSKIEKSGYFGSDVAAYHSYVLSRILSAYNRPAEYRKFAQKAFRMQPLNLKYSLNLLLSYLCQKRICKGSGSSASA